MIADTPWEDMSPERRNAFHRLGNDRDTTTLAAVICELAIFADSTPTIGSNVVINCCAIVSGYIVFGSLPSLLCIAFIDPESVQISSRIKLYCIEAMSNDLSVLMNGERQ